MQRALANLQRALARKSSYFDKIAHLSVALPQDAHESLEIKRFVEMGSFVEGLHLLTAVSACCPGLSLPLAIKGMLPPCSCLCDRSDKRRKDTFCSVYSFSRSCPKTVSRTREVFPTGSTTLLRLQLHAQEIVHTGHSMLGCCCFCFFLLERKVPAQSKLKE